MPGAARPYSTALRNILSALTTSPRGERFDKHDIRKQPDGCRAAIRRLKCERGRMSSWRGPIVFSWARLVPWVAVQERG